MRKCSVIVALMMLGFSLCGCGKQPGEFGNFADADSVELVRDAVGALEANFPPAKTRLALAQETEDAFGVALVETLRTDGYAVAEYVEPSGRDKYLPDVTPRFRVCLGRHGGGTSGSSPHRGRDVEPNVPDTGCGRRV